MVQLTKPLGCWLCMHIADNCLAPYTCYIFRQPPSPVLFLAGVRKTHLVTLLEALCLTLNSVSYKEVDLTSKNLLSLLELVCNQHSQVCMGVFSVVGTSRLQIYVQFKSSLTTRKSYMLH